MLDQFDKITGIISHFAIITGVIGLIIQLRQNKRTNKGAATSGFTAVTARYIKIQEILLSNENLNHLNIGIYKKRLSGFSETEAIALGKELAMCAMMFQVMEDAWFTHDLDKKGSEEAYSGWREVFRDWMNADVIRQKWDILKNQFGDRFVKYVDKEYLRNQETHAPVPKA